jgi:hypothetical protein
VVMADRSGTFGAYPAWASTHNIGACIAEALQIRARICEKVQFSSAVKPAKSGSFRYGRRPTGCFTAGAG